jgi:hypothetical protein
MTIAFPIWQDRISPLLDAATRLLVVTLRRGVEVRRREVLLGVMSPEALARSVGELQVDQLFCGALSEPLLRELKKQRIRVRPHLCGEVQAVLRAFCAGQLDRGDFDMPGCHCRHCCQDPERPRRRARQTARLQT